MARKVLITGGSGFIGSHFIRRFLHTHPDWEVLNFDKLTYAGNRSNLEDVEGNKAYHFVQGDICDARAVGNATEGVDAVVHFAAETHVDRSIDDDRDFLNTNVLGTRNLLDAASRFDIPKFIHISTDEVYGSIEEGLAKESFPLKPNSPYAASKAAGDLLVRAYQKTYGVNALIVRSTNNFGPFQFPEKVMPLFITNLIEGKKVPLYARGENRRDWIYVEDNCEAIELLFDLFYRREITGEIYNVAGGNELSNRKVTERILNFFDLGEEWIEFVEDRPGHDFRYALDGSKIAELGFRPRYSFEAGLEETVTWYRAHPEWWRALRKDKFTLKGI